MVYYLQVQTVILLYGIILVSGFFHLRHEDFLIENEQSVYFNISILRSSPTNWIEQPVDHFNYTDLRTWKQKYFKVMNSWKPEGPILLYLNGEGPLKLSKLGMTYLKDYGDDSQSIIGQIAAETGAAYFMLEHRYYGDSQPLNTTTENLRFLSSRQALADAAHFLLTLKESPEFKNSKVIVIGGSYAGNLAAWMKQLYPWLIDAVLSSSAPVLAKKDFNEYFETVTNTFRTYGSQECVNNITDKFNTFHKLFLSSEGIKQLKKENNICDDVDMTVPENQQLFFDSKINLFAELAQYRTPDDIFEICHDFNLFEIDQRISNIWNDDNHCHNYDFIKMIQSIQVSGGPMWCWFYQTCTEFGYFQSSYSNKQMFGNAVPVIFYYKMCRMLFGEEFNEKRVEQGVTNTNSLYGGLTPNVNNVVFVNGDMDPWHRLGILHCLSADVPAIYIKGASHCHDIRPDPRDTDEIKEARKIIKNLLKKWIGQA